MFLSTACPCLISLQQPCVSSFKMTVWSCSVKLFSLSEMQRYRLMLLSCVNLPTQLLPLSTSTVGPSLQQFHWKLGLSHLYAAWNKLDGKAFIDGFSFSFPKELERIAAVLLSMDKIQFYILQSYSPCDRTEFSPRRTCFFSFNQIHYDLTLAYKNELYLFDFLLIRILHTSIKEITLAFISVLSVCGSLAPLSGSNLKFYKEM